MAHMFDLDTEVKSLVSHSDGGEHQLDEDFSAHLRSSRTFLHGESNSSLLNKLMMIGRRPQTDNSDDESLSGADYRQHKRESRYPNQSRHRSESTPYFGKNDDSVYR